MNEIEVQEDVLTSSFFTTYYKRRRTTFRAYIDQGKLVFGYFKAKSNLLIEIENCLLIDKRINKLVNNFKNSLKSFDDRVLSKSKPLELHITSCSNGIDLVFKSPYAIKRHEKQVIKQLPSEVIRISWYCHGELNVLRESAAPLLDLIGESVLLPPLSFLQVSEDSQNAIIQFILSKCKIKKRVLDLFAGIGTYSIPIAKHASVYAVEGNADSLSSLKSFDGIQAECKDLYSDPVDKLFIDGFEMVIINPPRNGATPQIKQIAKSNIKEAILVYCDLQSFKRDSKVMLFHGWKVNDMSAIDQFYQSPHMEVVAHFVKSQL